MPTWTRAESKVLPVSAAVGYALQAAKKNGLSMREEEMMKLLVSSCPKLEVDGVAHVRLGDAHGFLLNLQKAIEAKDSSWLLQKRGLKVERVADIEEFVESADFLNQKGIIRPVIKSELYRLFTTPGYVEAVLTGAIGIGKNFFANDSIAYMLYVLSCYHNPQLEFELAPGTQIKFIMQSKTLTLAKKVVFEEFAGMLKYSKYFQEHFTYDTQIKSELRFPHQITVMPVGGSDTSALGMTVYGGIIDEMNFMERVSDSKYTRYTGEDEYDQAQRLYSTIIRRMKSRFMQKGKVPGKLMLVSSRNYPGDFTDRKIEEARHDPSIFVMSMSQWEALPADRFSGEMFLVEVGNEFKQTRIVPTREAARDVEDVVEVPVEYKPEFERDIDAALRDLGGIATGTRRPFIPYKELIVKAQDDFVDVTGGKQLFRLDEVVLTDIFPADEDPTTYDFWDLVDETYIEDCILDKRQIFASHIDVGLTGDAAGIAIGRIVAYKLLPSTKFFNERTNEFVEIADIRAPVYQLDGVLRCVSAPGDEVDLQVVRDLLMFLRGELNLKWATLDSYQSAMLIQSFRKARMRSGVLSVDTSIAPYTELKLAVKDERLYMPQHEILAKEMREIEKHKKKEKVDHPPGGSKDCSDAAAGVCYILQHKEASYGRPVGKRRRKNAAAEEERVRKIRVQGKKRLRATIV